MPKIVGLTGGIAMGKSTVAKRLRWLGRNLGTAIWLHDADKGVHRLMAPTGAAYGPIVAQFGQVTVGGCGTAIDRQKLGKIVFACPERRLALERILHPLIYAQTRRCIAMAQKHRVPLVVLDIPLLFEIGAEARCDGVLSVHVSAAIQRRRAMARKGMSKEKLDNILANQVSAQVRLKNSDGLIYSGGGHALAYRDALRALARLRGLPAVKPFQSGRRQNQGRLPAWPPLNRRQGFWQRAN